MLRVLAWVSAFGTSLTLTVMLVGYLDTAAEQALRGGGFGEKALSVLYLLGGDLLILVLGLAGGTLVIGLILLDSLETLKAPARWLGGWFLPGVTAVLLAAFLAAVLALPVDASPAQHAGAGYLGMAALTTVLVWPIQRWVRVGLAGLAVIGLALVPVDEVRAVGLDPVDFLESGQTGSPAPVAGRVGKLTGAAREAAAPVAKRLTSRIVTSAREVGAHTVRWGVPRLRQAATAVGRTARLMVGRAGLRPESPPAKPARRRWTPVETVDGTRVYQRSALIDRAKRDPKGRSNLQRMREGRAPVGPDNRPVHLHHTNQRERGARVELSQEMHRKYHPQLHINPPTTPSGVNRPEFDRWRHQYWKERSKDFESGGDDP